MIQHSLLDLDQYEYLLNKTAVVVIQIDLMKDYPLYTGLDRNGFKSSNYGRFRGFRTNKIIYEDKYTGIIMELNPYLEVPTPPKEFDFAI